MARKLLSQITRDTREADMATRPIRDWLSRYTILALLIIGAVSPLLRHDTEAVIVSAACVTILLSFAVQLIWRRR